MLPLTVTSVRGDVPLGNGDQDPRIEDGSRIERVFDGAVGALLGRCSRQTDVAGLGPAYTVLGTDRPAHRGDESQHLVIGPAVVGVESGDIDVQVAFGQVAEE